VFAGADAPTAERLVTEILAGVTVQPAAVVDPDAPGGFTVAYRLPEGTGADGWLRAVAGIDLTAALSRWGIERLRTCDAAPCIDVFVDSSRNGRRRYCGTLCQNRVSAAAHRVRKATLDSAG
jgi:predicted RNA-binding Zn ribbon-like protein